MKLRIKAVILWTILGAFTAGSRATVLTVPGEYPTIQEGISAAVNGDTVLVADGTYSGTGNSDITLMGKGITVTSVNGPSFCIIDGDGSHRGFFLTGHEGSDCIISGFTIIRGSGESGGGIYSNGSPQILNCEICNCAGEELGGGIALEGKQTSPLIADCVIHNNSSNHGGGISIRYISEFSTDAPSSRLSRQSIKPGTTNPQRASGPNVIMNNVKVFGNHALNGGGICVNYSRLSLNRSTLASNSSEGVGGGMSFFIRASGVVNSSIIIGNKSDQEGGGISLDNSDGTAIKNSIIGGNSSGARGAGIFSQSSSGLTLYSSAIVSNNGLGGDGLCLISDDFFYGSVSNNIIAFNDGAGISDSFYAIDVFFRNNLFFENSSCDFDSSRYGCLIGSNSINQLINNAYNNIDGEPLLDISYNGFWTEQPSYNAISNISTFTDSNADFTEGEFAGRIVQPDTDCTDYAFIIDNTGCEINVSGDIALDCHNGDSYKIHNFHLQNLSAALDRGDPEYVMTEDFEGDPRPGLDNLVDIGPDEAPGEYAPPADMISPESYILELPVLLTQTPAAISYRAYDSSSGVDYVELFYSINGGEWTQYPGLFTESPIMFQIGSAEEIGHYDFYSLATDRSGNIEDPPNEPDASTIIINQFSGTVVYVDIDASGRCIGTDWENAVDSINTAIRIADYFHVPEVWVAEGKYEESITMAEGVFVYGGFAGFEDSISERNYVDNPVIIDASTADHGQPAFHVLTFEDSNSGWFDGFTLTGGAAIGSGYFENENGGGIYLSYLNKECVIANCVITGNRANRGGGISTLYSNNSINNCEIIGNSAIDEGGGIWITGGWGNQNNPPSNQDSPFLKGCVIAENHAAYGGGIYISYYSCPFIEQTIIVGNSADFDGGGVNTSCSSSQIKKTDIHSKESRGPEAWITNSLLIGNAARIGGGFYCDDSSPSVINCNICYNSAELQAGGCFGTGGSDWLFKNCIFYGNDHHAICDDWLDITALTKYCLFENNPAGDYFIVAQEQTYNGAYEINVNVNNAANIIEGDPFFTTEYVGSWSECPVYLPEENKTILSDSAASFTPNALKGTLINPESSQSKHTIILNNTQTTIDIFGDYTEMVHAGDFYNLFDVHLQNGSAALDHGSLDEAILVDFENNPRPGPDGFIDMGMDEAPAAFNPPEEFEKPQSFVCNNQEIAVSNSISICYKASDAESGIHHVELFYKFEEGAWIQFPGQFTESPIPFFATEGNGTYYFYTIATDQSENQEEPPDSFDAEIKTIAEFPGNRIYVNSIISNSGIGDSWETALRTMTAAELIYSHFHVSEIWVAEGTYSISMNIEENIHLLGGFSGSEISPDERDIISHPTIFDASRADDGYPALYVIRSSENVDFSVCVDGFFLQGASSSALYFMQAYLNCSVLNSTFRDNSGGGAGGIYGHIGSLNVNNCLFENNDGYNSGCICWEYARSPVIISNSVFRNNTGDYMDTIELYRSELNMINCLFDSNGGTSSLGTMVCFDPCNIINCTFVNNTSQTAALMPGENTQAVYCVFWGNIPEQIHRDPYFDINVMYSCIQDGFFGSGNISEDPLLIIGPDGPYYLSQTAAGQNIQSPCVDAGNALACDICYPIPEGTQCFGNLTTRTDLWHDIDIVDMGFHYSRAQMPPQPPTATPYPAQTPYPTSTPAPTYTPYPTNSPPPVTNTPTVPPSPTPLENFSVAIAMPSNYLTPGTNCYCTVTVHNQTGQTISNCPLFVILWIENMVFFAPGWTSVDHYLATHPEFPPGDTSIDVINPFAWPDCAGACDEAIFFAAVTDPEVTRIMGDFGKFEFGWGL